MNLLLAIVYYGLVIFSWLIVARALLSWTTPRPGGALYRVKYDLVRITEPYLGFFRRRLHPAQVGSMLFDWSMLVALIVLVVAIQVVARL
jgi:YggT family protein